MILGREFGKMRGQPLSDEVDLDQLGRNIINLQKGAGFGEFAILNATQKLRSCAAVCNSDDTLLLILQADTYNACLRKFHYRQGALAVATRLLQELPLFEHMSFSKISQIAYTMKMVTLSSHSLVASPNEPIRHVYLIAKGRWVRSHFSLAPLAQLLWSSALIDTSLAPHWHLYCCRLCIS